MAALRYRRGRWTFLPACYRRVRWWRTCFPMRQWTADTFFSLPPYLYYLPFYVFSLSGFTSLALPFWYSPHYHTLVHFLLVTFLPFLKLVVYILVLRCSLCLV